MYVYYYEQRLHLRPRFGYNDPLFTMLYRVGLSYMSNILHFYRQVNFGESPKMKKTECTRRPEPEHIYYSHYGNGVADNVYLFVVPLKGKGCRKPH